jgi:DmsE family decaheme c-type cytochrome
MDLLQKTCLRAGVVVLIFTALLLAFPVLAQSDTDAAAYIPNDPATCLLCHNSSGPVPAAAILQGTHAIVGNPRSPFADGNGACQACHGPSAAHLVVLDGVRALPAVVFDSRLPAAERDAVCLSCHEQEAGHQWRGSAHEFAELSCSGCHKVHAADDAVLSHAGESGLCLTCHQRTQAETLFASSHPIRSGQMVCSDCHGAHGGPGPAALTQATLNEQCFQCHAEKRGPFLWEHAPASEDCSNCHQPHGSNHRALLQARTPFLCQQCHLAAFHPSNAESGLGLPPLGAAANLLGRDCTNCHTQVHGSNHPSGSGLTR